MGGAEYMISAYGLINDPTMRHFLDAARTRGVATRFVDLALAVECGWEIRLPPDERSWTNTPEGRIPLLNGLPAYCRLIDLGSIETQSAASWHAFTSALSGWLELDTGRVVNRPGHPQDNASKPLHEAILARMGLEVPPSFSGSGRSELIGFAEQGPTIAKALCGQRTDCRRVTVEDFAAGARDWRKRPGRLGPIGQRRLSSRSQRAIPRDQSSQFVVSPTGRCDCSPRIHLRGMGPSHLVARVLDPGNESNARLQLL